jgi:DNA-directed RNA polymerase subunit L
MMHRIKHDIKQHTSSSTRTPDSALYADYVGKLGNLSTSLKASAKAIADSEIAWKDMRVKQRTFAEQFLSLYPDKDIVREHGKISVERLQRLTDEMGLGYDGSAYQLTELTTLIRDYIAEVTAVQNQYKMVHDLTTDLKIYTKKCEDLTKSKKSDESKLSRNLEKREEARSKYDAKLEDVVDQMRRVYDRRGVVLRAAYVAFWGMQIQAADALCETVSETRGFVQSSARQMRGARLTGMTDDFASQFSSGVAISPERMGSPTSFAASPPSSPPNVTRGVASGAHSGAGVNTVPAGMQSQSPQHSAQYSSQPGMPYPSQSDLQPPGTQSSMPYPLQPGPQPPRSQPSVPYPSQSSAQANSQSPSIPPNTM